MKGLYHIAAMLLAVCTLILPKAHANSLPSFSHLAPADTVYYVEGSLSELETAMGYQSTDLLIQIHKLGLSVEGKTERQQEPLLSFAYDIGVKLANYLHESYAQQSSYAWHNDRYALYLDGVFPVLHLSTAKAQAIHTAILSDARQNSLAIRTETWDENKIWYLALNAKPDQDLGLLELTMVLAGNQLTLSVTSNKMPLVRKMKVLGLVPDAKSLLDEEAILSPLASTRLQQGATGFVNIVQLGRMLVANPTTTAGIDLNLYFPALAKDLAFKQNKRACTEELDALLHMAPFLVASSNVRKVAHGVELESDLFIDIQSPILAEHLYSLNGPLRLNNTATPMLLDMSVAFNFTDMAWKLLQLKNYFESYGGSCPKIRTLFDAIVDEVKFAEIALGASFVEGINGFNFGVSELAINAQQPQSSHIEAYASVATINLNIIKNAAQLMPQEYGLSIPASGTSQKVHLPQLPAHLSLVMQANDTELTARIGRDAKVLAQPMQYQKQPGIWALDIDLAAVKSLYSQIPMDNMDCHDLQRGSYMLDRLADHYSFVFAAQEKGLYFSNSLRLAKPMNSFSMPLAEGKYQFQYSADDCTWNTFDVINISSQKPYNVELGQIVDHCSEVSAVIDFSLHQGVIEIFSNGNYRASCETEKEDFEYGFDCIIESYDGTELICTDPEDDALYRLVKMDLQAIANHQRALEEQNNSTQ
ncbi:MAG TPA: hypothetical protein DE179_04205 [Oceanospirillaceae bacterium]|nr:hypothetical protein [Oceanospirillaceae bacterium]